MRRSSKALGTLAAAMSLALVGSDLAFADQLRVDVTSGGAAARTLVSGSSTGLVANYSANKQATTCDVAGMTVAISVPTGASVSNSSVALSDCVSSVARTFTSSTPGSYNITHAISDPSPGDGWTNQADFTLLVLPRAASALGATAGNAKVDLSWTASPDAAIDGYKVISADVVKATIAATSATITGLTNGAEVCFTVKAYKGTLESAATASVCATPAAPNTNTAPIVTVTGGVNGQTYELGRDSVPNVGCNVQDAEQPLAQAHPVITDNRNTFGVGTVHVDCSFTDNGGLSGSANATYTVADRIAPTIDSSIAADTHAAPASTGWWNSTTGAPTVTFTCADPAGSGTGSGIASCVAAGTSPASASKTLGEGEDQSVGGTATDNVGLQTSTTRSDIDVDTVAPDAAYTSLSPTLPSGSTWHNGDVGVTFTGTDMVSKFAPLAPSTTPSTTATQTHTITGEGAGLTVSSDPFTDRAGNSTPVSGAAISPQVNIDRTKPTSQVTGVTANAVYAVAPTVSCIGEDQVGLSGIATSGSPTGNTTTAGVKTVTCNGATDNAGNTQTVASASVSYTLAPMGSFNSNFDGNAVLVVKPNQAIPLKWAFNVGTVGAVNHALLTPDATTISSVSSTRCSGGTTDGSEPATETAAGASGLQLLTDLSYQMNWKANSTTGCRSLTVKMPLKAGGDVTRSILVEIKK